jgi:hypothetical protein
MEKHVPNFKVNRRSAIPMFTCPACGKQEVCRFIPSTNKIDCMACHYTDDIIGIAHCCGDVDFKDTPESIMDKIVEDLGIQNDRKIIETLDFYKASKFDLTPLQQKSKIPFELDWLNKPHTDYDEWHQLLGLGMNLGVKCGFKSGITIIDIDQADIPADIDLLKGSPLIQRTGRGWHFIYKYTDELPTTKIPEYKIDILNNGKQAVIYPSQTVNEETKETQTREFITPLILTDIPKDLLKLLQSKLNPVELEQDVSGLVINENFKVNLEDLSLKNNNLEGCCNDTFLQLGGILGKQLNHNDIAFTLKVLNQHLLEKPLERQRLENIIKSLNKYIKKDERIMANQILKYIKIVEFANSKEIRDALGFPKEEIDKALAYLVLEGQLIRKGRNFAVIKKAQCKEELNLKFNALPFEVPFFSKYAQLSWGDLILLASKTKYGKTTIAIGMIKELIKQGVQNIYYISSEAGSRFTKTAMKLNIKEGEFKWDFIVDPTKIALEPNAVTILDWLMIADKAESDSVMKHFADQLHETNGLLIAFMQLKENGDYFAPNMVKQYPALSARYLYTDETGTKGNWILDAIREPNTHCKTGIIPCTYDPKEKTLTADA